MTIAQNKLSLYTSAEQTERIRLDQINSSIEKTKQQVGGCVGRVLNDVNLTFSIVIGQKASTTLSKIHSLH